MDAHGEPDPEFSSGVNSPPAHMQALSNYPRLLDLAGHPDGSFPAHDNSNNNPLTTIDPKVLSNSHDSGDAPDNYWANASPDRSYSPYYRHPPLTPPPPPPPLGGQSILLYPEYPAASLAPVSEAQVLRSQHEDSSIMVHNSSRLVPTFIDVLEPDDRRSRPKPFICPYCPVRSHYRHNLVRHVDTKHPENLTNATMKQRSCQEVHCNDCQAIRRGTRAKENMRTHLKRKHELNVTDISPYSTTSNTSSSEETLRF